MTDRNLTHIAAVIDRSGSVGWPDSDPFYLTMQSGFDKLIAEQRQQPGKCTVTLAQFDDVYELVYTGRDINDVPPLRITPRNRTALLDAIGQTLEPSAGKYARRSRSARRTPSSSA